MIEDTKINKYVANQDAALVTRRKMLARLGLVAGALYAAPTLANLSEARASSRSFSSASGRRRRRRRRRRSGRRRFGSASR